MERGLDHRHRGPRRAEREPDGSRAAAAEPLGTAEDGGKVGTDRGVQPGVGDVWVPGEQERLGRHEQAVQPGSLEHMPRRLVGQVKFGDPDRKPVGVEERQFVGLELLEMQVWVGQHRRG